MTNRKDFIDYDDDNYDKENRVQDSKRIAQQRSLDLDSDYFTDSQASPDQENEFRYRPLKERQAEEAARKPSLRRSKASKEAKDLSDQMTNGLFSDRPTIEGFNQDAYYDDKLYDNLRQASNREEESLAETLENWQEKRRRAQEEKEANKRAREAKRQEILAQQEADRLAKEAEVAARQAAEAEAQAREEEAARQAAEAEAKAQALEEATARQAAADAQAREEEAARQAAEAEAQALEEEAARQAAEAEAQAREEEAARQAAAADAQAREEEAARQAAEAEAQAREEEAARQAAEAEAQAREEDLACQLAKAEAKAQTLEEEAARQVAQAQAQARQEREARLAAQAEIKALEEEIAQARAATRDSESEYEELAVDFARDSEAKEKVDSSERALISDQAVTPVGDDSSLDSESESDVSQAAQDREPTKQAFKALIDRFKGSTARERLHEEMSDQEDPNNQELEQALDQELKVYELFYEESVETDDDVEIENSSADDGALAGEELAIQEDSLSQGEAVQANHKKFTWSGLVTRFGQLFQSSDKSTESKIEFLDEVDDLDENLDPVLDQPSSRVPEFELELYSITREEEKIQEEWLQEDFISEYDLQEVQESRIPSEEPERVHQESPHEEQEVNEEGTSDNFIVADHKTTMVQPENQAQLEENLHEAETSSEDGSTVVTGAAWLTAGSFVSRVLGALYIIPWAYWLGEEYTQAATLYSVGYRPYALFLALATAGFPSAIAKQMAYYQSREEYKVADQLFKTSALMMLVTGLLSGTILYVLAPSLAYVSPTAHPESAILVIRSLVPALLLLPIMSLFRGYFQGFNDMRPSAISQMIEQFVRIAYILIATYAITQVYNGTVTQAVVHTTFAAFVGALAAFIYLIILYIRHRPKVKALIDASPNRVQLSFKESLIIMIKDSIPFILLGSGIIIMQFIDTISFKPILIRTSTLLMIEIDTRYGALSVNVDKLVMIIVSIATAISTSLVPVVSSRYGNDDRESTRSVVQQVLIVLMYVVLPAAIGLSVIGDKVYEFFYSQVSGWEYRLLISGALSSIILSLYTVLSMILQSMNYRRLAVRFLLIGILLKIILQMPFVAVFKEHGPIWSTVAGLLVASILMLVKINQELNLNYAYMGDNLLKIALATLVMAIVSLVWKAVLNSLITVSGRGILLIEIILVVIVAVVVYLGLTSLLGLLPIVLGPSRYEKLQDKLGRLG